MELAIWTNFAASNFTKNIFIFMVQVHFIGLNTNLVTRYVLWTSKFTSIVFFFFQFSVCLDYDMQFYLADSCEECLHLGSLKGVLRAQIKE